MTDELDALKAAMKAAAPPPEAEARAAAMRLAMENFDRLQGSDPGLRLSSDRPTSEAGVKGVWKMLKSLSQRPALAGATSVAALFAVALVVVPLVQHGRLTLPPMVAEKPDAVAPLAQSAPATAPGKEADLKAEAPLVAPKSRPLPSAPQHCALRSRLPVPIRPPSMKS